MSDGTERYGASPACSAASTFGTKTPGPASSRALSRGRSVECGPCAVQGEPARGPRAPHRTVVTRSPAASPGHHADHTQDGLYRDEPMVWTARVPHKPVR